MKILKTAKYKKQAELGQHVQPEDIQPQQNGRQQPQQPQQPTDSSPEEYNFNQELTMDGYKYDVQSAISGLLKKVRDAMVSFPKTALSIDFLPEQLKFNMKIKVELDYSVPMFQIGHMATNIPKNVVMSQIEKKMNEDSGYIIAKLVGDYILPEEYRDSKPSYTDDGIVVNNYEVQFDRLDEPSFIIDFTCHIKPAPRQGWAI